MMRLLDAARDNIKTVLMVQIVYAAAILIFSTMRFIDLELMQPRGSFKADLVFIYPSLGLIAMSIIVDRLLSLWMVLRDQNYRGVDRRRATHIWRKGD